MFVTKPRILCVEDEPDVLKFLEALLVPNGYEVIKVENGEEALGKIIEESIDLVLSDVLMPKIDGFELCKRIKADERCRNIPVILITGLSDKEDRIKGIESGAEDFISKPIDPREVLARIKMLLRTKALHERRIGELFIEMGFVTEQQLQKALKIAKEQNIKVGEALYSMGALDKDHIYWVLGNQLNMNYVELSPEMIDEELIRQFSINTLRQLCCLPLYETMNEIHFAIADPTDENIVKKIKGLRPEKSAELHLALPEKIVDVLNLYKEDSYLQLKGRNAGAPSPKKTVESHEVAKSKSWNNLVTALTSMPQNESYWLYKTPFECHLLSQKGNKFESIRKFPEEIYGLMKERLRENLTSQSNHGEITLFLREKYTKRQGAFKLRYLDCLDKGMVRIERIPTFLQEEFIMSHPQVTNRIKDLECIFNEHHRLLIGGQDTSFIKKCCYSLIRENDYLSDFPPPLFVENKIEVYLPKVVQLSKDQCGVLPFLDSFEGLDLPFLFYESELPLTSDEKHLSNIFFTSSKHLILCLPFSSPEAMEKAFSVTQDRNQTGFKTFFLSPSELKSV